MSGRLAAIVGLVLVHGCGQSAPPATPEQLQECARAPRPQDTGNYVPPTQGIDYELLGQSASERRAFEERARAGVVAVRLEDSGCTTRVVPLACTRFAPYASQTSVMPYEPRGGFSARSPADLHRDRITGDALLSLFRPDRLLRLRESTAGVRHLQLYAVVPLVPGERDEGQGALTRFPSLDVSELRGPDCASATHWVQDLTYGAFKVTYDEDELRGKTDVLASSSCQPPGCAEVIRASLRELTHRGCPRQMVPTPQGCMRVVVPTQVPYDWDPHPLRPGEISLGGAVTPGPCRPPVAGQMTEQAAQARRLFDGEKWRDASLALARVMLGETGDDEGNKQLASYYLAVALHFLGDIPRSNYLMDRIARLPCHIAAAHAIRWNALGVRFAAP